MIRRITGTLIEQNLGSLIIDVGGLGHEVRVALNASVTAKDGETVSLFTHQSIRENAQDLYGFPTKQELEMFELLLDLPGVGPKTALNIMSQADVRLIEEATRKQDASYLSKLSGIGKKSAEKIVNGLKDKIAPEDETENTKQGNTDLIDALLALGYTQEEALRALRSLPQTEGTMRERLKEALKFLGSTS